MTRFGRILSTFFKYEIDLFSTLFKSENNKARKCSPPHISEPSGSNANDDEGYEEAYHGLTRHQSLPEIYDLEIASLRNGNRLCQSSCSKYTLPYKQQKETFDELQKSSVAIDINDSSYEQGSSSGSSDASDDDNYEEVYQGLTRHLSLPQIHDLKITSLRDGNHLSQNGFSKYTSPNKQQNEALDELQKSSIAIDISSSKNQQGSCSSVTLAADDDGDSEESNELWISTCCFDSMFEEGETQDNIHSADVTEIGQSRSKIGARKECDPSYKFLNGKSKKSWSSMNFVDAVFKRDTTRGCACCDVKEIYQCSLEAGLGKGCGDSECMFSNGIENNTDHNLAAVNPEEFDSNVEFHGSGEFKEKIQNDRKANILFEAGDVRSNKSKQYLNVIREELDLDAGFHDSEEKKLENDRDEYSFSDQITSNENRNSEEHLNENGREGFKLKEGSAAELAEFEKVENDIRANYFWSRPKNRRPFKSRIPLLIELVQSEKKKFENQAKVNSRYRRDNRFGWDSSRKKSRPKNQSSSTPVAQRLLLTMKMEKKFREFTKKEYCGNIIDNVSHSKWMKQAGIFEEESADGFKKYAKKKIVLTLPEYKEALETICENYGLDYWDILKRMTNVSSRSDVDSFSDLLCE